MLSYLQQAINHYSDVSYNKSENHDYFFSGFQYKLFPQYFTYQQISTIRTQCGCETSPSDAARNIAGVP
jgi:hypothetical protein